MKLLFVVGCLLSATVRAQTDPPPALPFPLPYVPANPNAPEMNTREETAPAFKSHVTLVTVPVVVRNLDGVAVDNLTRASFQLFDKGKPQEITRFSMEKIGSRTPLWSMRHPAVRFPPRKRRAARSWYPNGS